MTIKTWAGQPEKRAQLPALVLLAVAIPWGLFHIAHLLHIHSAPDNVISTHDLYYGYYSIWFVLSHRDCADIALRESLYFPHTWSGLLDFSSGLANRQDTDVGDQLGRCILHPVAAQ